MSNARHTSASNSLGEAHGVAEAIREKGREVRDSVQEMGSAVRDKAQAGLESVRDTAHDYLDRGREKAKALEESIEIQIRTRPLSAVLIAAGVGFLVAMLWKRRD